MPAGRPAKTIEELKEQGTFRRDRHGEREQNELMLQQIAPAATEEIDPPDCLTDTYVINYWHHHTKYLIRLNKLQFSDIPQLEDLYLTLQRIREVNIEIKATSIKTELEKYQDLIHLQIKLARHFNEIAYKYYISPEARTRLKTEDLQLQKLENTTTNSVALVTRTLLKNGQ